MCCTALLRRDGARGTNPVEVLIQMLECPGWLVCKGMCMGHICFIRECAKRAARHTAAMLGIRTAGANAHRVPANSTRYQQALKSDPSADVHEALARCHIKAEQYLEAAEAALKAITLDAGLAKAYLRRG